MFRVAWWCGLVPKKHGSIRLFLFVVFVLSSNRGLLPSQAS